jgi:hypothetical protein
LYVYGVMRASSRPRLEDRGIEGGPVGCVCHEELAALVGDAPVGPLRPSRRNVMAHYRVLHAVVDGGFDVLPMRFGVAMPDAATVRDELLAAQAPALTRQLDVLAGRVELGVTVSCRKDTLLRVIVEQDPRLAETSRRLRGGTRESTHHERVRLGKVVAAELALRRAQFAQRMIEVLGPLAADAVVRDPRHEDMLATVAFLVDRSALAAFDAALERFGAELWDEIRVRCDGPLPPYHFSELELDPDAGAWAR